MPPRPTDPPAGSSEANWLWGGILAALFIPPVGFIVAIVVFAKGRAAHGMAILLTCFIGATLGLALVWGSALDSLEADLVSPTRPPAEPSGAAILIADDLVKANNPAWMATVCESAATFGRADALVGVRDAMTRTEKRRASPATVLDAILLRC